MIFLYGKVCPDELAGALDRTVHVAFLREVHHMRRLELGEYAVQLTPVADVDLLELEPVGVCDRSQVFKIACAGEFVDHADCVSRVVDDVPGDCRPDKSGAAGDDDAVHEKVLYIHCHHSILGEKRHAVLAMIREVFEKELIAFRYIKIRFYTYHNAVLNCGNNL